MLAMPCWNCDQALVFNSNYFWKKQYFQFVAWTQCLPDDKITQQEYLFWRHTICNNRIAYNSLLRWNQQTIVHYLQQLYNILMTATPPAAISQQQLFKKIAHILHFGIRYSRHECQCVIYIFSLQSISLSRQYGV